MYFVRLHLVFFQKIFGLWGTKEKIISYKFERKLYFALWLYIRYRRYFVQNRLLKDPKPISHLVLQMYLPWEYLSFSSWCGLVPNILKHSKSNVKFSFNFLHFNIVCGEANNHLISDQRDPLRSHVRICFHFSHMLLFEWCSSICAFFECGF